MTFIDSWAEPLLRRPVVHRATLSVLTLFGARPSCARLRSGESLHVDVSSRVGMVLWALGEFERDVSAAMTRILAPGDVFVDVGSHYGCFAVPGARKVGPDGRVYAIDMQHPANELLRTTRDEMGLDNLIIVEAAVGAVNGIARAVVTSESSMWHLLGRPGTSQPTVDVAMRRIDEIVDPTLWPKVTLMKFDVEGAETSALRGARDLIATARPRVIVEVWDRALEQMASSVDELWSELTDMGYEARTMDETNPFSPAQVDPAHGNVLFVPRHGRCAGS